MVCPQCGARIDAHAVRCSYCGYENETAAKKQHEHEIRGIYQRLAKMLHLPEKRAQKAVRYIRIGAISFVVIFLVGLAAATLLGWIGPKAEYKRQQTQLEQLEALYQSGEYEQLNSALEGMKDTYGASYDKYQIISDMVQQLLWEEESCMETIEFLKGYPQGADLLAYDLENLLGVLNRCDALEQAGYVYGEEEAVTHIREWANRLLQDVLLLTGEEIEQGKILASRENPDYAGLYQLIAERIGGGEG